VISISQSGETADTLAAMEEASNKGARQLTLCNYAGTQTTRVADGTILIRAGLEISVAGTKTFVCTLTSLYLLSMYLGVKRGVLGQDRLLELLSEVNQLPGMMSKCLANPEQYETLANEYFKRTDFLYLERALKLKEISYIHAEGYPAGEMKHGPISLIDENIPVVALLPKDELYEKMMSNVNEVKARGGIVIAIATEGDTQVQDKANHVIYIPKASRFLSPMLTAIPMQLLSYYIAVRRGCDVDQPRNLAKSVTVE
jgi:glucosamine--fructose-6-phosphate aminotransferase (isomerizing)